MSANMNLPWSVEYDNDTGPDDDCFVAWYKVGPARIEIYGRDMETAKERAEFIKLACNSHYELLDALQRCKRRAMSHPEDTDKDRVRDLRHIEAIAHAAIAKATGATP